MLDHELPSDEHSGIARRLIENALYVPPEAREDQRKLRSAYTLRRALVTAVVRSALQHAHVVGLDVEEFENIATHGIGIINSVQSSLTEPRTVNFGSPEPRELNWNFWIHDDDPTPRLRTQEFPYMNREWLLQAAYDYLDLPYRVPQLERLLVDLMIALELYAFTKEMFQKNPRWARSFAMSPLMQRHALWAYVRYRFIAACVYGGLAFLAANYSDRIVGHNAAGWLTGIPIALFALDFVFSTVMLPFAWRQQAKARKRVLTLIEMMFSTYRELNGEGDISTRRLRDVASKAADAGAVWPNPLFLLIDDNIARVGRL